MQFLLKMLLGKRFVMDAKMGIYKFSSNEVEIKLASELYVIDATIL
jgi:hypothetical protein